MMIAIMAYSLNMNASTQRITLCSSGTKTGPNYCPSFISSKALMLDERLLHLCSVEIIVLKHLTYFYLNYMNGEVTATSERGNVRTRQIQQGPGAETFNPYLQGV